jgi:phosphoesterase RecJ-like protein
MQLEHKGRIAVLTLSDAMLNASGCKPDDLEGLVNLPLAARDVRAVIFLKTGDDGLKVSLRSKDSVNVRQVAVSFDGGGHANAAGCTVKHPTVETRGQLIALVAAAVTDGDR